MVMFFSTCTSLQDITQRSIEKSKGFKVVFIVVGLVVNYFWFKMYLIEVHIKKSNNLDGLFYESYGF